MRRWLAILMLVVLFSYRCTSDTAAQPAVPHWGDEATWMSDMIGILFFGYGLAPVTGQAPMSDADLASTDVVPATITTDLPEAVPMMETHVDADGVVEVQDLAFVQNKDATDMLQVVAWVGGPIDDRPIWVRSCVRLLRFDKVFWRLPMDAGVNHIDWPDVSFGYWPADAVREVWFAAGLEGVEKPSCEMIHEFPMVKVEVFP